MNRLLLAAITAAALMLLAVACTSRQGGSSPAAGAPSGGDAGTGELEEGSALPESIISSGPALTVSDAAMYRGVMAGLGEDVLYLEQVSGTDFGTARLAVRIPEELSTGEEYAEGDYLEIMYGKPIGGGFPEVAEALVATRLPDAALCVHNGTLLSINPDGQQAGCGTLFLETDSGNFIAVYSPETQFYLNINGLGEGDRLSIFTTAATAEYDPPLADALEVRAYR